MQCCDKVFADIKKGKLKLGACRSGQVQGKSPNQPMTWQVCIKAFPVGSDSEIH